MAGCDQPDDLDDGVGKLPVRLEPGIELIELASSRERTIEEEVARLLNVELSANWWML